MVLRALLFISMAAAELPYYVRKQDAERLTLGNDPEAFPSPEAFNVQGRLWWRMGNMYDKFKDRLGEKRTLYKWIQHVQTLLDKSSLSLSGQQEFHFQLQSANRLPDGALCHYVADTQAIMCLYCMLCQEGRKDAVRCEAVEKLKALCNRACKVVGIGGCQFDILQLQHDGIAGVVPVDGVVPVNGVVPVQHDDGAVPILAGAHCTQNGIITGLSCYMSSCSEVATAWKALYQQGFLEYQFQIQAGPGIDQALTLADVMLFIALADRHRRDNKQKASVSLHKIIMTLQYGVSGFIAWCVDEYVNTSYRRNHDVARLPTSRRHQNVGNPWGPPGRTFVDEETVWALVQSVKGTGGSLQTALKQHKAMEPNGTLAGQGFGYRRSKTTDIAL